MSRVWHAGSWNTAATASSGQAAGGWGAQSSAAGSAAVEVKDSDGDQDDDEVVDFNVKHYESIMADTMKEHRKKLQDDLAKLRNKDRKVDDEDL